MVVDFVIYFLMSLLKFISWFVLVCLVGIADVGFGWLYFLVYSGSAIFLGLVTCAVDIDFHIFRLIYHIHALAW